MFATCSTNNSPRQQVTTSSPRTKTANWELALGLAVVTFLVYVPVWYAGFIWDDRPLIVENPLVQSSDGLYRFWFTTKAADYYPMANSLGWLEWRLWGAQPRGYHLVNVVLHAINAVLIWIILRRLSIPGAWLTAMVFAIHPVNVATVAWISEQKNTLSMLFSLVAVLSYLQFDEKDCLSQGWRWYVFSMVTFLLALLSKSAVVMLPVILLACVWWRRRRLTLNHCLYSIPFFILSLVMGLVTIWFQLHHALTNNFIRASLLSRVATAGWVPWFYLVKDVLPIKLMMIYPKWKIDTARWISYMPGIALAGCLAFFWCNRRALWGRSLLFGFGCFIVMLFPVLGIFDQAFYAYSQVADHWQYYSNIAVIALVVAAGDTMSRHFGKWSEDIRLLLGAALLIMCGTASWARANVYQGQTSLWLDNLAKNPCAWAAHNNVGLSLAQTGAIKEAVTHYEEALRCNPDFPEAHLNLGAALLRLGRTQEAIEHLQEALRLRPDSAMAHNDLGLAFAAERKVDMAVTQYLEAVRLSPDYVDANYNLGLALAGQGQFDGAIIHFSRAVSLQPGFRMAHFNLALALEKHGRIAEAAAQYEEALRLNGNDARAHNNLGALLARQGHTEEAIRHFESALQLNPDYPEAHNNLGTALSRQGRVGEATAHFLEAVHLKPDYVTAQENLQALTNSAAETASPRPSKPE
jgi:tetratricopeptide (TPR) repeat protein